MKKKQTTRKEEDAMSNKGIKKVLAVALLSTMGLVACSNEVHAKPSNYKEPLITFTEEILFPTGTIEAV